MQYFMQNNNPFKLQRMDFTLNPNGCRMTTTMTMRGKAFCKEEKSGMGNSSGVVFSNVLNLGRAGDLVIWRPLCSANKMLFLCSVRSALLWFAFALLVPCLCCCFQSIVPCFLFGFALLLLRCCFVFALRQFFVQLLFLLLLQFSLLF